MILVVNPNPAVDKVAVVDFAPGVTLRPSRVFEWPGGSGVHAAHVASVLGADVHVVCPVGGLQGERFLNLARAAGLQVTPVRVEIETRGTFSLLDAARGNICDVADPGVAHPGVAADELLAHVEALLPGADLVVVSGSVPPGWRVDLPAQVVRLADAAGVQTMADLTGGALRQCIPAQPWLVKPSLEELRRDGVVGPSPEDVLAIAERWLSQGVQNVCLSLAGFGLLWISGEGVRRVATAPRRVSNTIGSGATLVGAVAARTRQGWSLQDALRWGVAAATANLDRDEPGHCDPALVEAIYPDTYVEAADPELLRRVLA